MVVINMIFQVKADVHSVSGELIVSGLDSATSLIQVMMVMLVMLVMLT